MQSVNPVLPKAGFAVERLLPPRQAIVAFFARVTISPPQIELVSLDEALGRVLAEPIVADDDYPNGRARRWTASRCARERRRASSKLSARFAWARRPPGSIAGQSACRIPTGGVLPAGADAVVPIEDVRVRRNALIVDAPVATGANVVERGADMRRGEIVLAARRRIRAPQIGVLATLGVTEVPVYRRPVVAVFSSGDELVDTRVTPAARSDSRFESLRDRGVAASDGRHAAPLSDAARRSARVRIGARDALGGVRRRRVTRRLFGRRARSLAARGGRDRRSRRRRPRTSREAGKADALRRRRRQADYRIAGKSDVGVADARGGCRADRRSARRCADRRTDASGAPRGTRTQPRRLDVVRSGGAHRMMEEFLWRIHFPCARFR